jgi:SpoVK/Ycf46/Vps4 family AAA+-type ATPase
MAKEDAGENADADPVMALQEALGPLADVRSPKDAEAPILAPAVRAALFAWLAEINAQEELEAVGLKPRATALFYGPPGTGKTTLAHHLASRLGVPLVVVGSENLVGRYLGESGERIADFFNALETCGTKSVVLIDEIEGIGGHRDKNTSGGADNERTAYLGVLLRKLEEYAGYLIGATNRKEDIDPALWRRFHLQISIDLPCEDERFAILKRYGLPYELTDDDLDVLADATKGASPALLRGLMDGMKRNLIVRPRVNLPVDDAMKVLAPVVTSVQPPPEMARPPLWCGPEGLACLKKLTWPPVRAAA